MFLEYSKGGATDAGNLEGLCKGHHDIKHFPGWSVRHIEPGVLEWVTPHGIVATDRPDTKVRLLRPDLRLGAQDFAHRFVQYAVGGKR